MSDLSSYRQQVTQYGQRASEAESAKRYDEAYGHYMAALDVFMYLIKCKSTPANHSFVSVEYLWLLISRKKPVSGETLQRKDDLVLAACRVHQEDCTGCARPTRRRRCCLGSKT